PRPRRSDGRTGPATRTYAAHDEPCRAAYWKAARSLFRTNGCASATPPWSDCRGSTSRDPIGGAGRIALASTAHRHSLPARTNIPRAKNRHGHSGADPGPKADGTEAGPCRTEPPCVPFPPQSAHSKEPRRSPESLLLSSRGLNDPFGLLCPYSPGHGYSVQ